MPTGQRSALKAELAFMLSKGISVVASFDILEESGWVDDRNGEINKGSCILCDIVKVGHMEGYG